MLQDENIFPGLSFATDRQDQLLTNLLLHNSSTTKHGLAPYIRSTNKSNQSLDKIWFTGSYLLLKIMINQIYFGPFVQLSQLSIDLLNESL